MSPAAATQRGWRDIVAPAVSRLNDVVRSASGDRIPTPRDVRRFRRQLPMRALMATSQLAGQLRDLTGHDVIDQAALQDVVTMAFRASMVHAAHKSGDYSIDDFGFDPAWTEIWQPLLGLIASRYFRVTVEGAENIPKSGGALIVANHAGALPWDGAMINYAVAQNARGRHVRALVSPWMLAAPGISWFMRRTGQALIDPADMRRLLDAGEMVLLFPEGADGIAKPYAERYRLRRFGRGEFVATAAASGVPIIPVSVVGSEETHPRLAEIPLLARALGVASIPLTPTFPLLGPLGLVPLPAKWHIRFHEPVVASELTTATRGKLAPAGALATSEALRETIQSGVIDILSGRRTVIGG